MRKLVLSLVALSLVSVVATREVASQGGVDWALNTTVIEACTCPMFCQCYFASKPAGHHQHGGDTAHFCRFNNAYKINKGNYGAASLDGAKFWISGDLGGDFSQGKMDWAVVTFDKAMTKAQREGVGAILAHLFPVEWSSLQTAEGSIDRWEFNKDGAVATLDGGRTAEVRLRRQEGNANTSEPPVIKNLRYWGAPRNDGFVLMPNEIQAYRVGPKAYESKGTNGFMVTLDMKSTDVKPKSTAVR